MTRGPREINRRKTAPDMAWSVPVQAAEIPETGRHFDLVANAATREALAKAAGVLAVPRLEASFDVVPVADGLRVTGTVSASVEQTCVVTLDPVTNQVEEEVAVTFLPSGARMPQELAALSEDEDPPETLQNGMVDLGAVAAEFLLLGIDPYPRKPDTHFEPPRADADPKTHPFAALAALKKDSG